MAKKKSRIKHMPPAGTNHVKAKEPSDPNKKTPLFSFERVQNGAYCFSVLDRNHKADVAEAIFRRKGLTWNDLIRADRHGLGLEKIPRASIGAPIPPFVTDDVKNFIVLRYSGLAPMVGHRIGRTFYILWFDHNFSLYDHG